MNRRATHSGLKRRWLLSAIRCFSFLRIAAYFALTVGIISPLSRASSVLDGSDTKTWVAERSDGHLQYETDSLGNRIPDLFYAGYGGGGVKLPDVPFQKTVKPTGGDDSVAIRAGGSCDYFILGSQVLLNHCFSYSLGSYYVSHMWPSAHLNVVLNSTFTGKETIMPPARWSTSLLTDNCHLPEGGIAYINRGTAGSGHGWSMGWGVVWNSTALKVNIQQPPECYNWCIGSTGEQESLKPKKGKETLQARPWLASAGKPVLPQSLYLAQLRECLGEQALENIGY